MEMASDRDAGALPLAERMLLPARRAPAAALRALGRALMRALVCRCPFTPPSTSPPLMSFRVTSCAPLAPSLSCENIVLCSVCCVKRVCARVVAMAVVVV